METKAIHIRKFSRELAPCFFICNDATDTLVRFAFNKPSGGRGDVIIYGDYIEALEDCAEHQSVKRWRDLTLQQKATIINQVAS